MPSKPSKLESFRSRDEDDLMGLIFCKPLGLIEIFPSPFDKISIGPSGSTPKNSPHGPLSLSLSLSARVCGEINIKSLCGLWPGQGKEKAILVSIPSWVLKVKCYIADRGKQGLKGIGDFFATIDGNFIHVFLA